MNYTVIPAQAGIQFVAPASRRRIKVLFHGTEAVATILNSRLQSGSKLPHSKNANTKSYKLPLMRIVVNGQDYQTEARTAADLLQELQAPEAGTAMALNGEVVRRSQLSQTILPAGAKIEIVRAVQGG